MPKVKVRKTAEAIRVTCILIVGFPRSSKFILPTTNLHPAK
jgi:hypothetical protein